MQATHSLGLDLSKAKFDVCLRLRDATAPLTRHRAQFENRPAGFKKLRRWLTQHLPAPAHLHACLEATSRSGDALALDLHAQAHTVSVVNPRCVRHYADSRLVRTQHDALDAEIIADYCATQSPPRPSCASSRT